MGSVDKTEAYILMSGDEPRAQDLAETAMSQALPLNQDDNGAPVGTHAPAALTEYLVTPDGGDRFIRVSAGSRDIWELEPEVLLKDSGAAWRQVDPGDVETLRKSIERAVRRGPRWSQEWRSTTPSGVAKWIRGLGTVIARTEEGVLFECVLIDVTEEKAKEAALLRGERLYRESERRFRDLAANVPGAIFRYIRHPDGRDEIDYMSAGCEVVWGFSSDEIQNDPTCLWQQVHPDDLKKMLESVARSTETLEDWQHSWRYTTPAGEEKWLEGRGVPNKTSDGDVVWNALVIDVTSQKTAQQKLRDLANAAESADRAKTQFLANMSHELRTPLNSIIGFTDVMKNKLFGEIGNPKYAEYVGLIHGSANHLLSVIGDVLDVSRIEAGEYDMEEEEVDLDQAANFVLNVLKDQIRRKSISFKAHRSSEHSVVRGDAVKLKRAILNVVSNAVAYTPEGGRIALTIDDARDGGLSITTQDSGPGIPCEAREAMLKPFTRLKSEAPFTQEGTGLGLFITKSILELHDGGVSIGRSRYDGARVDLTLPGNRLRSAD